MKLPDDFRELLEEFDRDGVEHVVIGGYAFAYHAEPRATKDLDILLNGSQENLERAGRPLPATEPQRTWSTRHGTLQRARSSILGGPLCGLTCFAVWTV